MIVGTKDTIGTYKGINERIDMAIDFILNLDPNIEVGRYDLDGDNVFAKVMYADSTSLDDITFEAHRRYLDLQYIVEGSEYMGYAPLAECTTLREYSEEKDCGYYKGDANIIKVNAGSFYLAHPFDAHAPGKGYEKNTFKKVVVKIKID